MLGPGEVTEQPWDHPPGSSPPLRPQTLLKARQCQKLPLQLEVT